MGRDSSTFRWLDGVPLWAQLLLLFATFFVARLVGELVGVWYTCGRLSAYFVDGVRIVEWKPVRLMSNGLIVSLPIEPLIIFPLWAMLAIGSFWIVGRLRRGRTTGG